MKDIKDLYNAAKNNGKSADISAYKEAIQMYLENNPYGYMSNLEYIITSDIGVKTLKEFVETNGLPIQCFENVLNVLEECVRKCEVFSKDSTSFTEAIDWLSDYRQKYIDCFMMYEYYQDQVNDKYIETYYGYNESGIPNRKLVAGLINAFSEAVIPDMLITSDSMNEKAVTTLLEFCANKYGNDQVLCEWLVRISNDISEKNFNESVVNSIKLNSLTERVTSFTSTKNKVFRESVILQQPIDYEFDESEIQHIKDLISFKEYCLTWADEIHESVEDLQKEIYSLYQELSDLEEFEEDEVDIIGMDPGNGNAKEVDESTWVVNTRDKKKGSVPTYIGQNHDMARYGEDDGDEVVKPSNPDMSEDDYKRPSAANSSDTTSSYEPEEDSEDNSGDKINNSDKGNINNYYYYTYQNSLNKNSNSFNKDNSSRDDHSIHRTNNNYDSSTGKHINSHNGNSENNNNSGSTSSNEEDNFEDVKESAKPWELNIFNNNVFTEEVGDADDMKPQSDHPVKDILTDIDRATVKTQQKAKKKVQDIANVGRAAMKPINRTKEWVGSMIGKWKDADETNIKEKMADPHARNNLFTAIKKSITIGSLLKAGILLNPVFLFLTVTRGIGKNKREFRIRNEMIGELKAELEIIDEKIKDANDKGDNKAKYQLMRFKNELNKKLLRVGGGKRWAKII